MSGISSPGFVRSALSRYTGTAPDACVFITNRYGKPSLRRAPAEAALEFNLSHTNGLAAIAVSVGREVGIDVEDVTRANVDRDVRRRFSATEIRTLESMPRGEQSSRLCNARAMGEFGAVYVVSGHITGQTDTMPLRIEKLFQEYDLPGSFAVASVLTLLAILTLIVKSRVERTAEAPAPADARTVRSA